MVWILGKIECCFCKKKEGLMSSVHGYGIYGHEIEKRVFYHPECLELVEINSMQYNSLVVDKALHIIELKKKNTKKFNNNIIPNHNEKLEKLRTSNFDRMIEGSK